MLRGLTDAEAAYYLEHMTEVQLRFAFPFAQLEATILNMMGGKRKREAKEGDDPPLSERERYSPLERLPWYARPEWAREESASITREAARDFLSNVSKAPSWVLEIAPLQAIRQAAKA